ncbi:MAG: ABC transporter permease, partial [Alistipes sp.]
MFVGFVARRYLFAPKSRSVVNLIAGLSVFSVAMPVAAMIILLSVFNGFETLVKSMCSAFDADLTVTPVRGQTFALGAIDTAALTRIDGVTALSYI